MVQTGEEVVSYTREEIDAAYTACVMAIPNERFMREAGEAMFREHLLPKFEQVEKSVLYGCIDFQRKLPTTSLEDVMWKWKFPGHTGYVLGSASAVRLPSRPIKGSQGVFYVTLTDEESARLSAAGMIR